MSIVDIILSICFVPALVSGIRKGFISQVVAIISIIAGVWISFEFSSAVGAWLGQYIEATENTLKLIAFIIIMIAVFVGLALAGRLLEGVINFVMLGWLNKLLGVAFALLKTSGNTDAAGAVLEALSAYKYKTVLPAYFEVALKTKYSRDDTTSQMCDIIRDSMVLDFGFVFNNELGNPIVTVFEPSFNNPTSMSSTIASQKQTIETKIEDFLGKLADVE